MLLNVKDSVFLVTQSFGRIVSTEPLDEGDGRLGHVTRELDVVDPAQDDVIDLHGVARCERRSGIEIGKIIFSGKF
jgi:hypothetical protein